MKRREFLAGTGILIGTACVSSVSAADDETAVKHTIKNLNILFEPGNRSTGHS